MSSHTELKSQCARKTPAKSNMHIEPVTEVVSLDQGQHFTDTSHDGQQEAQSSPDHVSSRSSSVSVQKIGIGNVSPARNSVGYYTTGGKRPDYRVRLEPLYGSQTFNEASIVSDSEDEAEAEEPEEKMSGEEDENDEEREDEGDNEQKYGDDGRQDDRDDEGQAASDNEESILFSQAGSYNGLLFGETGKVKPVGVAHLKGLYMNQMNDGSTFGSLAPSRGLASNPASFLRGTASIMPPKSERLADYPALNSGGFVTTSRKVVIQDGSTATLASNLIPTVPKQKQPRVTKFLQKDKVLLPVTIFKKYNRREMNQLLIEFNKDPQSGRFKSMKAKELAEYLNNQQQKFVDALVEAENKDDSESEDTALTDFKDRDTTLVDPEPVVTSPSRKRARVDSEDEGNYINTTFKKVKTGSVVDVLEDDVIKPHGADAITAQEADGDMGTMSVVEITKTLCAIERAARQGIEIQKADLHQSNGPMGQDQDIRMMILFNAQGNPRISLNAQVGVHQILRLKDEMLPVYQQTGLYEEEELSLSKDLDIFQAMLRNLSSALASKISDEDVDSEQVARDLVNRLFAQDVEDGRI